MEQKVNGHKCWPSQAFLQAWLCTKFERNPVSVVRVTAPSVFISKMAASLNDIKKLFDVHDPQTIPDLGVKFQII